LASAVEILVKARDETSAAFKAIHSNLEKTSKEAAKTNDILGQIANDLRGKLTGAAEGAAGKLGGLGTSMSALGPVGLAAAAGIGAVAAAVGAAVKVSIDAALAAAAYGDKIADLAGKTDLSTKSLQAFDVMARTGNTSVEAISAGVLKMSRGLVDGSDAFRRLGLDVEKLKRMTPEEQFKAVAVAIESLGTNAERSAARVAVFGKSGDELTTVLHEAATGATELGGALSEGAIAASAELQDKLDLMSTAWERVILQFGAAIAQSPEVQAGLTAITDMLVLMATKIGEWAPAISALFSGISFHVQQTMAQIRLVTRAATGDGIAAWKDYKNTIQQLELDQLFADVVGGGSAGGKKTSFGPDAAALKAAADAAKKAAAERIKALEDEHKVLEKTALAWDAFYKTIEKEGADLTKQIEREMKARTDAIVKGLMEEMLAQRAAAEERKKSYEDMAQSMLKATEDLRRSAFDGLAGGLDAVSGLFEQLGITADSTFGGILNTATETANMIAQAAQRGYFTLQDLANQAINIFKKGSPLQGAMSGAMMGFAVGGPMGAAVGGGLGLITGALGKLFGGANKAKEEMLKLRNEFLKSQGGMAALQKSATAAGVSLDAMFKAKSAAQLQAAIGKIKADLASWEEGQNAINEAMEKYGISVQEMGPAFAQQELDKKAAEVAKAFAVLTLAGGDASVIAGKMGGDVLALVEQYKQAGVAIPAALRPILEQLLAQGKLVDEAGNAYGSLEEAGITFAETMTDAMRGLMEQIEQLIKVLARGLNVPINFEVSGLPGGDTGGIGGGGGGGHRPPRDEGVPEFAGAAGGIISRPAVGLIGEAGPEALLPLTQGTFNALGSAIASAISASGGGGQNIRISVVQNNREVGQTNAFLSRTRQQRTSPNANRRF
jgi:hypothetical protein